MQRRPSGVIQPRPDFQPISPTAEYFGNWPGTPNSLRRSGSAALLLVGMHGLSCSIRALTKLWRPNGMADVIFLQLAGHLSFCQEP